MSKQARIVQLKITELSQKGLGKGTCCLSDEKQKSIEVPFTMPGDECQVRLIKKKKDVREGIAQEWLHLSEARFKPQCLHFGGCGGCLWQHIAYEDQLKQKETWIHRHLQPFMQSNTIYYPIIPCFPWRYRNKIELSFSTDKAGKRYLGFILYGTRGHVFQMQECHLVNQWMIEAVKAVAQWWENSHLDAYHLRNNQGTLRTLTLREGLRTGDRMVVLTVSGNPDYAIHQKQLDQFVEILREVVEPSLSEQKLSIFLKIQQVAKGQRTQFYEMLLYGPDHIRESLQIKIADTESYPLHFRISPSAFFQPNTLQAEKLYSRAVELTQSLPGRVVYDLYCGTGTLGICMAKQAKKVIGVELQPESVLDARENVKTNRLSNVFIHAGDVGKILPTLLQDEQLHPDVVMIDPPRAGLDDRALQHLMSLKAPILTYISCNPVTQAANLAHFVKEGYQLRYVQPVDQFPHTAHIENIIVLVR